jgi:hypothetical protein
MMNRFSTGVFALSLLVALPAATFAAPQEERGGGVRQAAPVTRPVAPPRAAPVFRAPPAPQSRPAPVNAGGFNFNHDINARPVPVEPRPVEPRPVEPRPVEPRPITQQPVEPPRQITPQRPVTQQRPPNRPPVNYPHAPNSTTSGGPYRGRFVGPVVRNTHAPSGNWAWNRGVVWRPAPVYWGGGFWGPFAFTALGSALAFGAIADDQAQLTYPSYQAQPDTPGWDLLQDYNLQQTPCGEPDLVVIWGPDDSVICAFPNGTVAPGNYQVDPATFTLEPAQ